MKKNKREICIKEIIIRLFIMLFLGVLVYLTESDYLRQSISTISFLVAFLISIVMYKHCFPLMTGTILCFLLASVQEMWHGGYTYLALTKFLWTLGNILFPISLVFIIFEIRFFDLFNKIVNKILKK